MSVQQADEIQIKIPNQGFCCITFIKQVPFLVLPTKQAQIHMRSHVRSRPQCATGEIWHLTGLDNRHPELP